MLGVAIPKLLLLVLYKLVLVYKIWKSIPSTLA